MRSKIEAAIIDALEPRIREAGLGAVAEAAGIQQPSLSSWLAGRRSMPEAKIDAIAEAVGVELRVRAVRLA